LKTSIPGAIFGIVVPKVLSPESRRSILERFKKILAKLPHPVRWAVIMVVGFILLIMGLVMMVTPGPGLLFIFFGLSVLALEIEWARELNKQGLQGLEKLVALAKEKLKIWRKKG
jgi:uncharacterized protein (TIGR02611 family)